MQDTPNMTPLTTITQAPPEHAVSPISSRNTSLASQNNYTLENEAQQYPQDSNDSETEDVETTAAGRDVSTDGSIKYKRVAAADNDGSAPEATLPKSRMGVFTILTDCAAVLLPISSIVFTIIVWRLNGTENTAESREGWQNAITILATVFPILFASVVGRLTYEAARWKLERGTTLGALEQLIGSRTVGATLLNLLQLRSFNILSAALVAIWAFSPLGYRVGCLDSNLGFDLHGKLSTNVDTIQHPRFDAGGDQGGCYGYLGQR
ncbi:hypothetical protein CGCF413_v012014 [Colletotrichum fructicola]|nr:hypothetical protein CGCF413_v012014 [Colletotrichum fructicola]